MSGSRQEFTVVIDGIDLDEDQKRMVSQAVQQAAANALAATDFKGDFASFQLPGRLQGRAIRVLSEDEARQLQET